MSKKHFDPKLFEIMKNANKDKKAKTEPVKKETSGDKDFDAAIDKLLKKKG